MVTLLLSFLAGILTVATPCSLPLLPVALGNGITEKDFRKSFVVISSLSASILIFTLLLKVSTSLISIPTVFWDYISGGLITLIGISFLFPTLWERISELVGINRLSNKVAGKAAKQGSGTMRDILIGFSLGPIFASCSPTYAYILAIVLPGNFVLGLTNIVVYILGLALTLVIIAFLGNLATDRLKFMADPNGLFRKLFGIIMIVLGVAIITGMLKEFETYLLQNPVLDIVRFEIGLLRKVM